MTTSISLLLHGDLAAAWRANWAGVFVGVIGGAATVWLGFLAATGGRLTGWSAEKTIVRVFGVGAFVALLRYALLAAEWLIAG
jgi:VIT1/CCC1 family predicted Fe2+/Mn2+ transporter